MAGLENKTRLSEQTLKQLKPGIQLPNYDRRAHKAGIVHLGTGAFHRAHQAVYTDEVLGQTGGDWMITGANLFGPATRDRLGSQDNLYSVTRHGEGTSHSRIIGSIKDVLFAPQDPQALIRTMSDASIKIISLTITEKGYNLDPASIDLSALSSPPIASSPISSSPKTAIAYLVVALAERKRLGHPPVALLSCDNLQHNGQVLKSAVLDLASSWNDSLATWIESNISFPSTMVDRIVPAQTSDLIAQSEKILGLSDGACLATENFSQWVIEDAFPSGRPPWELAGVIFSAEVEKFETMKLRLLNGAHSAIAYLGFMAGKVTVAESMATEEIHRFVRDLMQLEIAPTVEAPQNYDLDEYIDQLITRFGNVHLQHQCRQIAMDGSSKLPQRLLTVAEQRLDRNQSIDRICMVIGAWILYNRGFNLDGVRHNVIDPMSQTLLTLTDRQSPDQWVDAYLSLSEIFSPQLKQSTQFRQGLVNNLKSLLTRGVSATLKQLNSGANL